MVVRASIVDFVPDLLTQLRSEDAALITADTTTTTAALDLDDLVAYWNSSGDFASLEEFRVVIGISTFLSTIAVGVPSGQTAIWSVVTDSDPAFGSATTVASATISQTGMFEFLIAREQLIAGDTLLAVKADLTDSYQIGTVTFDAAASEGTKFRINDGTHGNDDFTFGTYETGSFTLSGALTVNDEVIVNDGVNAAVHFKGVASGAVAPQFNLVGTTNGDAQALKAAIDAQIVLGTLDVTTSGATNAITIKNHVAFTGGTLSEVLDFGNKIATVNFTGGVVGLVPGATAAASAAALAAGIPGASDSVAAAYVNPANTAQIFVINHQVAAGATGGTMTEQTDSGSHMVVVDWTVRASSVGFWAYVVPPTAC